jgi:hypothetical protein
MKPAAAASMSCPFMAELADLLNEPSLEHGKRTGEATTQRLNRLEDEARRYGAREETMAAIHGTRLLLELAELPGPSRGPSIHGAEPGS